MKDLFTKHPNSVGETYFQHMKYALGISFRLFKINCYIFIHAFCPFVCETKGSEELERLACELRKRKCEGSYGK